MMNTQSMLAKYGKRAVLVAAFGALCFFAGVPQAQAEDGYECRLRVERAEARLRDAVEDHGYYSRQANDRRRDLYFQRERCENEFRYRRNDHDRDDRYRDRDDRFRYRDHDRDWDRDYR